jgi:hypothetical protein
MRNRTRIIAGFFSSLPSIFFGICVMTSFIDEYFWSTYAIMAAVFFGASLFFGLSLPSILKVNIHDNPWLWIFISGAIAWLVSLIGFGLINLTPLCIGQDNGDGINGYPLCFLYTLIASLLYSPALLVVLILNAFISGKLITRLTNPEKYLTS